MEQKINFKSFIKEQIKKSIDVKERILSDSGFTSLVQEACELIINAYKNGGKILIAGNGGSAADAQHIATEFIVRFKYDRDALPAIALTTNTSVLTAAGNDYSFKHIFSRQIDAYGKSGDIFIAISTSGNSPNVIMALETARKKNIQSIGFSGETGGKMASLCNVIIKVPSTDTPAIQESHIMIGHIVCAAVEEALFGSLNK
jgi:D-sedoheptulose 7-phosphate isomerase